MSDYWQQQKATPLFNDIAWSRPENAQHAGKLLIIGGYAFAFAAPGEAYAVADKAGAGALRVLLPQALEKLVGHGVYDAFFAPQNPSGSFSKQALGAMLVHASWADAVLLAGDVGKNSETAILLDAFVKKYTGLVCITKDVVDYFMQSPHDIVQRPNTIIVLSYEQLQKIGISLKLTDALTFGMPAPAVAKWLHEFTVQCTALIVTYHNNQLFVAQQGKVVSQVDTIYTEKVWRVQAAAKASVFAMQHPDQHFEAVATSLHI